MATKKLPPKPSAKTLAVKAGKTAPKPDAEAKAARNIRKGADKKFTVPKTIGACADRYYELREKRLEFSHQADDVKAEESFVKEHLISVLPKSDSSGVAGKVCRVTVTSRTIPKAENWPKIYAYIVDEYTKLKKARKDPDAAFAILNRALSEASVTELWDAKRVVPGVGKFRAVGLSVSKL